MRRSLRATTMAIGLIVLSVMVPVVARQQAIGAPLSAEEQRWIDAIYSGDQTPLWIGRDGQPNAAATDGLAVLARAADHGLNPADYSVADLHALRAAVESWSNSAQFEVSLSLQLLRYFHDVHGGRVNPRAAGFGFDAQPCDVDLAHLLRTSAETRRLGAAIHALAPQFDQYAQLRNALAFYRMLASAELPPIEGTRPDPAALRARLEAFGDLRADSTFVEGVKRFQRRHGLAADGVVGPQTRAALAVPIADRVHQIELALERLRWLPPLGDGPVIALNVPMFRLWGWQATPSSHPELSMRAIVGQAIETETPMLVRDMRQVVFRPYWNVPASILKKELLPIILRNPGYLDREGFEIVRGGGDTPAILPNTDASIRSLQRGTSWLRQRPGPKNALGSIEFVVPNGSGIYLHGTPQPELFDRTRRDFSHGCIRVEDPVALATWVLSGQTEWTQAAIEAAATAGPVNQRVDLERPVRVVIFYTTAAVLPEDGTVHFADDIYGHDATLDRALREAAARRADIHTP